MKWLKSWRSIILAIIVVGLVAGGWYFAGQSLNTAYPQAYSDWKDKVQSAADGYREAHDGALPLVSDAAQVIVDGDTQHIIDICTLLDAKLILLPPDNCAAIAGGDNDNCDSGNCSCHDSAHYIWTVDADGNVHSTCIGDSCDVNEIDGYQGVWP
ncbi:MAG: hypothetical protein U9N44_02645 [Chloroflexota bacterium]|nr:hypothetical protein [Chloroflexota bacterium]